MKAGKILSVLGMLWGLATMAEAGNSVQKPVVCTPAMFDCQPLILVPDFADCPKEEQPRLDSGGSPIDQPCVGVTAAEPAISDGSSTETQTAAD